jgi:hypothetical protein
MPLLDADIAAQPTSEGKQRRPLIIVLVLALVVAGVTLGIFAFVPEQATQTVRQVVQAAKSLLKKEDPPADGTKEDDFAQPAVSSQRKRQRHDSTPVAPTVSTVPAEPPVAPPLVAPPRLLHNPDLPPGTSRVKVREILGEPDLIVSKVDHGRVVEHFVYVNSSLHSAISVLLIDGRVTSIQPGTPSVGLSKTAAKSTPAKRD